MRLLTLLIALAFPAGTNPTRTVVEADPPAVVCTIAQIADAARNIGGDRVRVIGLMGEGVDPHLYQPSRSDTAHLLRADLVLYNGLHLEGKMTEVFERLISAGRRVHAVTERMPHERLLKPEQFEGAHDPHVWMDPSLWMMAVAVVRDALIDLDPAGREMFTANAESYIGQIKSLDEYAERVLATVPDSSHVLVTAHDAFNYFGARFDFEVLGIQGISTESEAGVRHMTSLVDTLVSRRVQAVFIETTVADRNIKALIAGAKSRGHDVIIGGELFSDAMGKPDTYEGTYIGMIDHNVTTITRALGGEAPERGMNGKLRASHDASDSDKQD